MQQLLHRGAAMMQHREEALGASWDDLKSFLACAKYKSFRNAAEALRLTSTTLMRRIDRLEERIGCKLFLRDQSGLTLSDDGAACVQHLPPRGTVIQRHGGHRPRCRDRRTRQFLDTSQIDRFSENLSKN